MNVVTDYAEVARIRYLQTVEVGPGTTGRLRYRPAGLFRLTSLQSACAPANENVEVVGIRSGGHEQLAVPSVPLVLFENVFDLTASACPSGKLVVVRVRNSGSVAVKVGLVFEGAEFYESKAQAEAAKRRRDKQQAR